ncbi:NifU-like domain protein [Acidihalobacter prosperus]|uniref:NifU-like domain protein n=1 Tax=Acidihalobacter prosperus TaxID=160660 RepID=A0A1A6C845_9GAMM|nr:NifU-like domain protein [Acidihalobacter prosperus]
MTTEFSLKRMDLAETQGTLDALLSDDPEHHYSEDELDAIEAIDPELALRIDRVQTQAARALAEGRPATGPIDLDAVRAAIEEARAILLQDGGDIEFVALEERTVRVRLKGACVGCPRATLDLRNVVERLVRSRVPGVAKVANQF